MHEATEPQPQTSSVVCVQPGNARTAANAVVSAEGTATTAVNGAVPPSIVFHCKKFKIDDANQSTSK